VLARDLEPIVYGGCSGIKRAQFDRRTPSVRILPPMQARATTATFTPFKSL
jgi:hypothetical protein